MTGIGSRWMHRLLENGLFWMALVLLSIGAGTTCYQKIMISKEQKYAERTEQEVEEPAKTANTDNLPERIENGLENQKKMKRIIVTFYP